jgi:glutaredoxin
MGDHFGKRKGALVKKQKTQNQPSRRLLSLWVWGHDPWRYARKVEKRAKMPKCPDVPWVGMTEKRKYGKIPVIMSPRARSNPLFKKKRECPPPQKKGITIYGAEWCHWCGEAKKYLDKQGTEYKYVDIDKVKNYQKVIYPLTKNYPYVPVIFIDGKFIGGYSELTTRKNPEVQLKRTPYRSYFLDSETGEDLTGIPFGKVLFKKGKKTALFEKKMTREEANKPRAGKWYRVNVAAQPGRVPIVEVAELFFVEAKNAITHQKEGYDYNHFKVGKRAYFDNFEIEGPVYPTVLSQMDIEPSSVLLVKGDLNFGERLGTRRDVADWEGNTKGGAPHFKSGSIKSRDRKRTNVTTFAPEGDKMRMDLHVRNFTKKTVENQGTITISDEGDHYFLHSVQVAPKFRGQGMLTELIGFLFLEMPDRLPGHPKKPVRTLVRAVEGIPQKKLVELFEERFGFRPLEEVDGGVLMEFKWPSDGMVIRDNPVRQNIPRAARSVGFTRKDIVYSGEGPQQLSANLLKAIKKTRHQNREYFGYANSTTLWYATNFETTSAGVFQNFEDRKRFMKENDIFIGFHTHPIRFVAGKMSRLSDIPSPPDYAFSMFESLVHGIRMQIVCTQHGFFIIEPMFKKGMQKVLFGLKDWEKAVKQELEEIQKAWDPDSEFHPFRVDAGWLTAPKTPRKLNKFTTDYINSITKYFQFKVSFLDNPVLATKWKPHEDKEGVVRAVDLHIRVNPHYTPPPNIAMFPGEMPMGPAALYQQTVSISQLQGLQRVSPSVLANGRSRSRRLAKQARRRRSIDRASNFCKRSGGKRKYSSIDAANADYRRQRRDNPYIPDMHGYGPCEYCGKYHLTKSVRRNPGVFEIASLIYEFLTARKRKKSQKELETRLDSVEGAMAELEALINADLIDENTVKEMLDREIPKEAQALILEDLKKRQGESSARVSPGEPPKFYLLATGVTEHEMEAERITKRLEIHPDKPIRIGLFVGAFGHERHVAEMCQELEVAYVVDPMNFDAEIVERTVTAGLGKSATKVYHAQMTLTEFLNMYEFTSTGDPFSLVHFPHRPSSGEEYRGVGIAKQLDSEIPRLIGYCSKATIFAGGINRSLLHEGHVYVAQPVTNRDKKMKEWWKNYKPPPPSKTTPPTTESEGVDLDDIFEEVSELTIPEQPVFTNREWISGIKSEREVHTKVLKISGLNNTISGFVSDRIEVSGMDNIVDVTIMPSTEVQDSGMRNTIKTKVVKKSEFYKTTRRNPRTKKGRKTRRVRSNPPTPHDGDAIITVNEVPWGTFILAECPFDDWQGEVESSMEDACNHIYPSCGHVLRINPDKPCCCENSEHPPTHPDHWPNTRDNPRTKKGRKFPKKYLKNLTPTEKAIAMYEIDRGYEYDENDPEAYKFWESDIKAKARGLKTVPSKWRNKFAKKYGPLKEGKDFLTRISKTTGIKRSILKKIYDKGLAAWRVGHRPGVQQHQWAAGRVYAFVMGADSSTGPGKPDHKLAVEAGVR